MFHSILLPIDGTDTSIAAAENGLRLAQYHGATVTLLTVAGYRPDSAFIDSPEAHADSLNYVQHKLLQLRSEGQRMGLTTRALMPEGDAATEILLTADRLKADLIVMAAHSRSRIESLLLGSVSQAVLCKAPCPVMIYGHNMWDAD